MFAKDKTWQDSNAGDGTRTEELPCESIIKSLSGRTISGATPLCSLYDKHLGLDVVVLHPEYSKYLLVYFLN